MPRPFQATYSQRLALFHMSKDRYWLEAEDISFGYAGKHIVMFSKGRGRKKCTLK